METRQREKSHETYCAAREPSKKKVLFFFCGTPSSWIVLTESSTKLCVGLLRAQREIDLATSLIFVFDLLWSV